jgi:hypothetical protein
MAPAPARWATRRSPERPTYGGAIAGLSAALGRPLMPWQRQVADVATERLPDGSWAYGTVILHVQRQAGKTTLLGPTSLHRAGLTAGRTWFTAQTRQDARDTWLDVAGLVRHSRLATLAKIRESNGSEAVTMPGGGTFRVFAPVEDALHGKANEMVTVDEAWAFDLVQGAALLQAIRPTFATTAGQLWIISAGGTAASQWLRGYVDSGRAAVEAGRTEGVAYFEWSLDPVHVEQVTAGLAADQGDPARAAAFDLLLAAHPANGYTLKRKALEDAAEDMAIGEFLRAYGNVWTKTDERIIAEHLWSAVEVDKWPPPPTPAGVALAFDVAPDRGDAAIAAAWRDTPAGPLRYDVIDAHPGDAWLVPRLRELRDRWRPVAIGHDAAGPVLDVADELRRGGVELAPTKTADYAAACAGFLSGVVNRRVEHPGRPALDDAVANAARRTIGDGAWAWSRRASAGTIAPLVAATVAGWTYDHRPKPATRPVVVAARRRHVA